jgi:hypothetical protein
MTDTKFPNVTVKLVGRDGNAFMILGLAKNALKKGGATTEQVSQFMAEAMNGDYDHLLQTVMAWMNVR